MSFQLWTTDNPTYLKEVLPSFQTTTGLTNNELVEITAALDLSDSVKRVAHLTQYWYLLGLLDRDRELNRAYRYRLSEFGGSILTSLQFSSTLAIDFLHWAMYGAWLRLPDFEWGWSWLYRETCDALWENSPGQIVSKKLLADMLERANLHFSEAPTFDIQAIRSAMNWLSALEPPFLIKEDESKRSSPWSSQRRESCSPELLFLAIQLQYHVKGLSFGTPLLMDEELVETLCKVCMLALEQFWPMAKVCSLTFPTMVRKETAYGTSWTIIEPAPFTPPEPRSTKATFGQGDK